MRKLYVVLNGHRLGPYSTVEVLASWWTGEAGVAFHPRSAARLSFGAFWTSEMSDAHTGERVLPWKLLGMRPPASGLDASGRRVSNALDAQRVEAMFSFERDLALMIMKSAAAGRRVAKVVSFTVFWMAVISAVGLTAYMFTLGWVVGVLGIIGAVSAFVVLVICWPQVHNWIAVNVARLAIPKSVPEEMRQALRLW